MDASGGPAFVTATALAERARMAQVLAGFCGLPEGQDAQRCGRIWCGYFDDAMGRCGLLVLDVPARLGPEALRWFAAHRTVRDAAAIEGIDESLRARTCAF
jgi:hypothetical protein